jgi:hypothetical protein
VEPITPCTTSTPEITPAYKQSYFSGRRPTGPGSIHSASTGGANSRNIIQGYTICRGSIPTQFAMEGHDPTIQLPKFQGEATKELEKHLFIFAKI